MSQFNAEKFLESMQEPESTEEVDQAFAVIYGLLPSQRKAVAGLLADEILAEAEKEIAPEIRQHGLTAAKQMFEKELSLEAGDIKDAQIIAQVLSHVEKIQGNATSPLIKAFNEAAANLTDEEYNGPQIILKVSCAVAEALAKSEGLIKPNPLRKAPPATRLRL